MHLTANHLKELIVTTCAQLSFQLFTLLIFRHLSVNLSERSFGFIGLWMIFNTSISTIVSSPISTIAIRFSGTSSKPDSTFSHKNYRQFYPPYLLKLIHRFVVRYLLFFRLAPVYVLFVLIFGGNYEAYLALIFSFFYGLSFGHLIILLGYFHGQRRRLEQLFVTVLDGGIKLLSIIILLIFGFNTPFFAMAAFTASSILSLLVINTILPHTSNDFKGKNFFLYLFQNHLSNFNSLKLNLREAEQVGSATKYGVLCGTQAFFEVYIVGLFYGLETSAALVLLTKFIFTPSLFLANSFLAHLSPILFSKSEFAYQKSYIPSSLRLFVKVSPFIVFLLSLGAGIITFYAGPFLLSVLVGDGYLHLVKYLPYFAFSGMLTGLSFSSLPIIHTFCGSKGIYRSRSFISIISLTANLALAPLFGIWGSTISFMISSISAYLLLNVRYSFSRLTLT